MKPALLFSTLCFVALAGCDLGGTVCTEIAVYGLSVTVVDDSSGDALCGATVTASEGNHQETLQSLSSSAPCAFVGAVERAGTYVIEAEATGYVRRSVADVKVDEDECHVIPQNVEIRLSKI